jgi:hypothetical protein
VHKREENYLNTNDKYKNKNKRINDVKRLVIKYPAKKITHRDGGRGGGQREPVAYVVQENVRKSDQLE